MVFRLYGLPVLDNVKHIKTSVGETWPYSGFLVIGPRSLPHCRTNTNGCTGSASVTAIDDPAVMTVVFYNTRQCSFKGILKSVDDKSLSYIWNFNYLRRPYKSVEVCKILGLRWCLVSILFVSDEPSWLPATFLLIWVYLIHNLFRSTITPQK